MDLKVKPGSRGVLRSLNKHNTNHFLVVIVTVTTSLT